MKRRRAFTLPEVLVSLALLGWILPVVMQGLSLSMTTADDAKKRIEAASLAESKLAEMTASMTGGGGSGAGTTSGDFGAEWSAYRWESSASSVETDLSEVRVRVWWLAQGRQRAVNLASFVYTGSGAGGQTQSTTSGAPATPPPSGGAP